MNYYFLMYQEQFRKWELTMINCVKSPLKCHVIWQVDLRKQVHAGLMIG